MNKVYCGIDNGVSGSLGIINCVGKVFYLHTPIKKELNYTKVKKWLNRIDLIKLKEIFNSLVGEVIVYIERPMINPMRFQASVSAIRALEATLIAIEEFNFSYQWIDSKEWQKELLPSGLKGPELKEASLQVAKRLFPKVDFKGFEDADGLLIAEYCRKKNK
jgi:hypothetical protein